MPAAWLTVKAVAERLTVSEDNILGHIRAGRLRAVNFGNGTIRAVWRISEDAVDEFVESRAARPPRPARRRKSAAEDVQYIT